MLKTKTIEVPDMVYEKGDKRLEIYRDQNPIDPRTYSNVGIMFCGHKRYELGDEQIDTDRFSGWSEIERYLWEERNAIVVLPLYLYDHSGITIKVGPFSQGHAHFDSGQVGFIYTNEKQLEKMGIETRDEDKIEKWLREEVETYDKYLTGQVYRFQLYGGGEQKDSCGGFFGTDFESNGLTEHAGVDDLSKWEEKRPN
jgi:hypothetical protein